VRLSSGISICDVKEIESYVVVGTGIVLFLLYLSTCTRHILNLKKLLCNLLQFKSCLSVTTMETTDRSQL
jgi:hypothetical protein